MRTKDNRKPERRKKTSRILRRTDGDRQWGWSKHGKPDPAILANIVERVVRAAKPEKIVLFGSAARGTMGPNSDIDLLVIKAGNFDHWRLLTTIYRNLRGDGAPVDVVLATPQEVERYRDTDCLVICPAMREGKVIYDALSARRSARMA